MSFDPLSPMVQRIPSDLPRILWIELTSKCPFDCIFCSRRFRRAEGEHLDFELFESLMHQLEDPEVIRLNYSGESIHYPRLAEAIRLAKATGAQVELVSVLASASEAALRELAVSGLDRLTVSLHTMRAGQFKEIYGLDSLEQMREKIVRLMRWKSELGQDTPRLDFAFVAMKSNLSELMTVASFAQQISVPEVAVIPVICRDPIAQSFDAELKSGRLRESFRQEIVDTVKSARWAYPKVNCCLSASVEGPQEPPLGYLPKYYPSTLPAGAILCSCDQDPWESVHVLANGDIVACEVWDHEPLGNLKRQSLGAIWHSEEYTVFRRKYVTGVCRECAGCAWKMAQRPFPLKPEVRHIDGMNAQFLRGWHARDDAGSIWSRKEALLLLGCKPGASRLLLSGALPPASNGSGLNALNIRCNGSEVGCVENPTAELLRFEMCLGVPAQGPDGMMVRFKVHKLFNPLRAGINSDARELGFAFFRAELRP